MSILNQLFSQPDWPAALERVEKTPGAVLLDVRSEEEYAGGHVPGAVSLPLNRLAAIDLPKSTPLFVYCLSGARSRRACAFLTKQGYQAEDLGGISGYRGPLEK